MGKFLMKMEQKYGKYALDNLPLYFVLCSVIGFFLQTIMPGVVEYLYLNPYLVLRGQIWRLFTWVLVPDSAFGSGIYGMLMMALVLYCYYVLGNNLQFAMGKFRYNLYVFSGLFFTVIGSFILYAVSRVRFDELINYLGEDGAKTVFTMYGTTTIDGESVMLPAIWFRSRPDKNVHATCHCGYLSECSISDKFPDSDKSKMAWRFLRGSDVLYVPDGRYGNQNYDSGIPAQFHCLFPCNKRLSPDFTKGTEEKNGVPQKSTAGTKSRKQRNLSGKNSNHKTQVCHLRADRTG